MHRINARPRAIAALTAAAMAVPAAGLLHPAAADAAEAKTVKVGHITRPSLTVSPRTNLRDGTTITVRGTGYDTSIPNPFGTGNAGTYVEIGWIKNSGWRPSQGFPEATRSNAAAIWVHSDPTPGAADEAQLSPDGSFQVRITVDTAALQAKRLTGATLAVFTVAALGTVSAGDEADSGITVAKPAPHGGHGHHAPHSA